MRYLDINEFKEFGYLQEVNRQFFHPLGLALEIVVENDGSERLGGIWDCCNDLEGIVYNKIDKQKIANTSKECSKRRQTRKDKCGFVVQVDDLE